VAEDAPLTVHTAIEAELEIGATYRHLQPFEQLLGKPVRLETAAQTQPVAVPSWCRSRQRGDARRQRDARRANNGERRDASRTRSFGTIRASALPGMIRREPPPFSET
jgi:hypothetical protein